MPLSEYSKITLSDFGGVWSRLDPTNVPPNKALVAQNCEFGPGQFGHRKGFGIFTTGGVALAVASMWNWIPAGAGGVAGGNFLAIFDDSGTNKVWLMDLQSTGVTELFTPDAAGVPIGAIFASSGIRFICVTFNEVSGADHGRICTSTYADKLFPPPLTNKPTLGGSGSGSSVTAGLHRVGYLIQSRTGYSGRLSPISSSTLLFDTTSTVTPTAGQQIDFSITLTWPSDAALVYPVMTTKDNLNRYFLVPGLAPVAVVGGVSSAVAFTITVSDADLASVGTDVTANEYLLTQNTGGTAPFKPFSVGVFGSRMVYLTSIGSAYGTSQAYASEPDNHQQITADQHVLMLSGQREMTAQGSVGKTLYILGPNWTYAFEDTGDVPVLWPSPRLVDGSIGTLSSRGFTVDASTGIGWCAHQTGLYVFNGGAFDQLPVTYDCEPTWKRINWISFAANMVQVIDNKDRQQVHVLAPLLVNSVVNTAGTAVTLVSGDEFPISLLANSSGATPHYPQITINGVAYSISSVTSATALVLRSTAGTQTAVTASISPIIPTHLMTFDYSAARTAPGNVDPGKVKHSPWIIKNYAPGAAYMVKHPTSRQMELWLGQWAEPSGADPKIFRQKTNRSDTAPYSDNSQAIDFQYEHGPIPTVDGAVYHHHAQQIRATGSGSLSRTMYGIDRTKSSALAALTLSTAPGQMHTNRFPLLRSEGASCRFSMNTADAYCIISEVEHYFARGPSRR